MLDIILRLEFDQDASQINRDTREFVQQISDDIDPGARLVTTEGIEGTRSGSTMVLGEIAIQLLTGEAIANFLSLVQSFLMRKRGGKISVTRADGASVAIELDSFSEKQFDETQARLFAFLEAPQMVTKP